MDYRVSLGDETKEVKINPGSNPDSEEYFVILGGDAGKRKKILVLKRKDDRLLIDIDGKVYSIVQLEWSPSATTFLANGKSIHARSNDSKKDQDSSSSLIATANELVASNFPAKIVKLLVK